MTTSAFHIERIKELLNSKPVPSGGSEHQRTRWIQLQNELDAVVEMKLKKKKRKRDCSSSRRLC
jgi:hypothetical protein